MRKFLFSGLSCLALLTELSAKEKLIVLAGGVSGAADLTVDENSDTFRASGGGLYLHNNGWERLDDAQRRKALGLFKDRPLAIELGFKPSGKAWGNVYRRAYLVYQMSPLFIAANAFAGNNLPTPEQWRDYMTELRKAGVPETTKILPTFEFANFSHNIPELSHNKVSDREDFQKILAVAGGIVIDSPSGYFFTREQNYRDWVVDALHWCRKNRLTRVVIASPHIFGKPFPEHTRKFVGYLKEHEALPDIWVCENYNGSKDPETYLNRVGSEDVPANVFGTARLLLTDFLKPNSGD